MSHRVSRPFCFPQRGAVMRRRKASRRHASPPDPARPITPDTVLRLREEGRLSRVVRLPAEPLPPGHGPAASHRLPRARTHALADPAAPAVSAPPASPTPGRVPATSARSPSVRVPGASAPVRVPATSASGAAGRHRPSPRRSRHDPAASTAPRSRAGRWQARPHRKETDRDRETTVGSAPRLLDAGGHRSTGRRFARDDQRSDPVAVTSAREGRRTSRRIRVGR